MPLPEGGFLTIEQVLAAQWNQFLASRYPSGTFEALAATPVVEIDDAFLRIIMYAQSHLNAYQLQPVIEPLEAETTGLGWFVEAVLTQASGHGLLLYDMGMASYMLEVFHADLEEFTDQAYARALLLQNGRQLPRRGRPLPQQTIDQLREQYGFWPSDLLADVGGHAHLLRQGYVPAAARPKVLSARGAARWLANHSGHALSGAVAAAIALQGALARDPQRAFSWNGEVDETETLGALGFVAWQQPQLLFEAVQHFEENQHNGGMAVEALARRILPLADASAAQLRALARGTVAYLHRCALLARLLACFPIWEDSDAV